MLSLNLENIDHEIEKNKNGNKSDRVTSPLKSKVDFSKFVNIKNKSKSPEIKAKRNQQTKIPEFNLNFLPVENDDDNSTLVEPAKSNSDLNNFKLKPIMKKSNKKIEKIKPDIEDHKNIEELLEKAGRSIVKPRHRPSLINAKKKYSDLKNQLNLFSTM